MDSAPTLRSSAYDAVELGLEDLQTQPEEEVKYGATTQKIVTGVATPVYVTPYKLRLYL